MLLNRLVFPGPNFVHIGKRATNAKGALLEHVRKHPMGYGLVCLPYSLRQNMSAFSHYGLVLSFAPSPVLVRDNFIHLLGSHWPGNG